ncbi:polyketide synthase, partial [Gloeophyllum trabeum ATCC 11539]
LAQIGIAAQLPSGSHSDTNFDFDSFFRFLLNKGEAYETIPVERFNVERHGLGRVKTKMGSFLKDIDLLDAIEFGMTSKDARLMPLGGRKLIETAFLSLLDSGIDYRGKNVGCFMAAVAHDIWSISGHDDAEAVGSFTAAPSMVANRVSYHLDLRGPSVPVDTACSSSLYATHLAVQALRNGECEAAVVGGCQINHRFADWLVYSQGGILSPDGKCKPFDASANGFGRGEGVVCIVLKPTTAAIRDGDKIYANVRVGQINHGLISSSKSFIRFSVLDVAPVNAPVASAQYDAMRRAFAQARRDPREVDYVELHATGTAQGDPTEANWIGEQFLGAESLCIGSVKGNIGHLEITSFLASLCKVCGMFQTGVIPPNVNFRDPNPLIQWERFKLQVPTSPELLGCKSLSGCSLIAMSSSGIGGANGHCVIEEPSPRSPCQFTFWREEVSSEPLPAVLVAAGLTPRSAAAIADELHNMVTKDNQHDISCIYGRRSRSLIWRSFSVAVNGRLSPFSKPVMMPRLAPKITFVFSGQGPQHIDMGYSLMEKTGLFSATSELCNLSQDVWPISVTLPAIAMVQMALVDTLSCLGITPDAVLGHSAGETALLYASGAGSKVMAMELAIARSQAMMLLEDQNGAMAALSCSQIMAEEIIKKVRDQLGDGPLEIGCLNGPDAITLSGLASHIDLAVDIARSAGFLSRRLTTRTPVHSSMMEKCAIEYKERVSRVFSHYPVVAPTVAVYSTVSGQRLSGTFSQDYFWDNARQLVKFTHAVEALAADHPDVTFIEISPHPVLTHYIQSIIGSDAVVTCPMSRPKHSEVSREVELYQFAECLGRLVVSGHNFTGLEIFARGTCKTDQPPPSYPFSVKQIPYVAPTLQIMRQRQHRNGPLNYPQLQLNTKTHPELAGHIIKDEPIMPAAGFLEMVSHYLLYFRGSATEGNTRARVRAWCIQRMGRLKHIDMRGRNPNVLVRQTADRSCIDFYRRFTSFAQYGSTYQRVTSCYHGFQKDGQEEILIQLRGNDGDLPSLDNYVIHPAILDAAMHALVHPVMTGREDKSRYYLPSRIGALLVHRALLHKSFSGTLFTHATLTEWTPDTTTYDVSIFDTHGACLCTIEALEVALHGPRREQVHFRYELTYVEPLGETTGLELGYAGSPDSITPSCGSPGTASSEQTGVFLFVGESFDAIVIEYARGREMNIKQAIVELDPHMNLSLWFISVDGMNGQASFGFTRSLRQEYRAWTIRCVVFPYAWKKERMIAAVRTLANRDCELEVMIGAHEEILVPRLVPSAAPSRAVPFEPAEPWVLDAGEVTHISLPGVPQNHVLVHVADVSIITDTLWAFIGEIQDTTRRVIGMTAGPLTNVVATHVGSIADIPSESTTSALGSGHIARAIGILCIGPAIFRNPLRLNGATALVTQSSTELRQQRPNYVVSACQRSSLEEMYADILHPGGRLLVWRDKGAKSLHHILEFDPWTFGDALRCALNDAIGLVGKSFVPLSASLGKQIPDVVAHKRTLFKKDKTYLLIGGIGSLGIEIALWMYQLGARHIVLTSRSGVEGVSRRELSSSMRILSYLKGRSDLSLRLLKVDATSLQDMGALAHDIGENLGGCMLLSGILEDRTFALQTEDTFERPFPPKINAFLTLQETMPVHEMDFVIVFSSVVAVFGNAGQTNYTSANTALAGLVQNRRNMFCLVCPAVNDSAVVTSHIGDRAYLSRISHIFSWGVTCSELCSQLEDGLLILAERPIWQYVPHLDWNTIALNMGRSKIFNHLISDEYVSIRAADSLSSPTTLRGVICQVLEIAMEDLSPDVPLTSYGLDSLSAASLSSALLPFVKVSQIQLLADVTIRQLETRMEATISHSTQIQAPNNEDDLKAQEMLQLVEHFALGLALMHRSRSRDGASVFPNKIPLLTGTTGSLGSHVLSRLLMSTEVEKIYLRDSVTHIVHIEAPIADAKVAVGSGYSESKWVAESLLAIAAERAALPVTVVRVHQLSGSDNGAWKSSEWFPSMVSASVALGYFPSGPDTISWLPVSTAAAALSEMIDSEEPILHLRHPSPVPWSSIANPIAASLNLSTISFQEWFQLLREELEAIDRGTRTMSRELEPGIRAMDVYRTACPMDHPARAITDSNGITVILAMEKALQCSPTLRDPRLPQIQPSDALKWIDYWRKIGFLPEQCSGPSGIRSS